MIFSYFSGQAPKSLRFSRLLPIILLPVLLLTALFFIALPPAHSQGGKSKFSSLKQGVNNGSDSSIGHLKHKIRHKKHHPQTASKIEATGKPLSGRHMPPPGSNGEEINRDWYRKRAWPNLTIDPDAYPRALAEARALPVWGTGGRQTTQATMQWQLIGPRNIGGRVSALAVDPIDSNTFYAGAAAGGVWKTADHGQNWACINDTFASLPTGAIAVDPQNAQTIYLGQGESDFSADSYPGNGMWKSTNGGVNWVSIGLLKTQYIAKIIIDPSSSNTLYVAVPGSSTVSDTNRGIYKSIDGGQTWIHSLARATLGKATYSISIVDLAMNPLDHSQLAAFSLDEDSAGYLDEGGKKTGLWYSSDAGSTWSRIDTLANGFPNGVKLGTLSRGSLCWVDSSGTAVLFAALSIGQKNVVTGYRIDVNFYGLFRSTNPYTSWTQLQDSSMRIPYGVNGPDSANILFRQGDYDFYLASNPLHPNELYIGGIDVFRSSDYGRTFKDITIAYTRYLNDDRSQHSDQHALAFTASKSGNDLLLGSDGGVFNTLDYGNTWTQMKGLPITMFYAIEPWWPSLDHLQGPLQATDLKVFGGTQDNGTVGHGFSNNADWDWINRGDGGVAVANSTDSTKLFTSAQQGQLFYRVSLDSLKPNLKYDLTAAFDTINYNTQWHQFSVDLLKGPNAVTDSTEPCAFIPPMLLDNSTGTDIYTGRIHVYHAKLDYPNKGVSWQQWSPVIAGYLSVPKTWYYGEIDCLAFGPKDASGRPMLWEGGSMVTGGFGSSVYRTTVNPDRSLDSAPTWIRVTGGLPLNAAVTIIPDRSDSLTALIAFSGFTAHHIYKTTNGGKNWVNASGNLPNAPIDALLIDTLAEGGSPALKNNCMIAAMDVGVFVTTDGGSTWSRLGTGMPNVVVHDIKLYKNWLIAGTDGRSAWALDVSNLQATAEVAKNVAVANNVEPAIGSLWPNPVKASQRQITVSIQNVGAGIRNVEFKLVEIASGNIYPLAKKDSLTESAVILQLPPRLVSSGYLIRMDVNGVPISAMHLTLLR